MARGVEVPLAELGARLTLGRALAAAGDREAAVAAYQAAAALAAAHGAERAAASAARGLRRLGSRVGSEGRRAALARGAEGLTDREASIVELVVAGRSNKEIAAALFLSEKTVEANLSRVYAKLGVRGRRELA